MAEIRPLSREDAKPWAALRHALWPEENARELASEITILLGRPDCLNLGAFTQGALVGFSEISIRPYGDGCRTTPVAWLEAIYVVPDHRRAGIGGALVKSAEAWARDRGLLEFGSDALLDNVDSHATHRAWGFAETERVVMFRKDL